MLEMNVAALFAAVAASAAVYAHGVVGHRWFTAQLRSAQLQPSRLFGGADAAFPVFATAWHIVTATFLASAVALYLSAFEAVESRALLRFIALAHVGFLAVGLLFLRNPMEALRRPIPPLFVSIMVATAALAWIASSSV